MLVLTRKPNQQLHIGNDIVITIVKVRGNTIRLGIEAPKDVRVIRSELEPKPASSQSTPDHSQASAATGPADAQPEADAAASSDDAQEAAPAAVDAAPTVIFKARIKPPARGGAPLKRFAATANAKRSHGAFAEHNLEDCPLCHRAPQAFQKQQSTLALHTQA